MKTEEKFYQGNQDLFRRYFESSEQYQALIRAGNFSKIQEIIKNNSTFNAEQYVENLIKERELRNANA